MILKNQISIFLSAIILLLNCNASLVSHYCHGKVESISFLIDHAKVYESDFNEDCCETEDFSLETDKDSCCKNEKVKLEKKQDFSPEKQQQLVLSPFVINDETSLPFLNSNYKCFIKNVNQYYVFNSNAPPLYLKYKQLVFYA